jgi:predicted amidohydrolase
MAADTPPDRVIVAAAQYPLERLPDLTAVKAKYARWAAEAAAQRARLLVFPEYGLMELAGTCEDRIAADLAASLDAVARLRDAVDAHVTHLARTHGLHILGPSGPFRDGHGRVCNAATFATPEGRCHKLEKCIMTPFEHAWGVAGGSPPVVLDTALGRLGVLICYDCEFPLLARAQTIAGARLLLIPSCTERISGYFRVRTGAMARALENTVAAVQAPTVGDAPWSPAIDHNAGAAGIYAPPEAGVCDTGVIAEGPLNTSALVIGEIDFAALARAKESGEMRNACDWALQPGATAIEPAAIIDLRA